MFHDYPIFGSKVLYRQFKKFALVGNSRGSVHPSTAQGLNLGIRDIDELMLWIMNDEDFLEKLEDFKIKKI